MSKYKVSTFDNGVTTSTIYDNEDDAFDAANDAVGVSDCVCVEQPKGDDWELIEVVRWEYSEEAEWYAELERGYAQDRI